MTQREKFVETAKKYIGCVRGDARHKRLLDLYNGSKPLARGYAIKPYDPWCQTTVSAIAVECGFRDFFAMEVSCQKAIDLWKKMGCWVENDAYIPTAGDIIYYDWQDTGYGDCVGNSDHVGIVASCDGNTILVIEGNMNNACGYRKIAVNGRYIRGFAVPKYKAEADPLAEYKNILKQKAGLADVTIKYLEQYQYGTDLIKKLANAMK